MAIWWSDDELTRRMREVADKGKLVTMGWSGFRAVLEAQGYDLQPEEAEVEKMIHWSFWAGARCVFDALHHLEKLDLTDEQIRKLYRELGSRAKPRGS